MGKKISIKKLLFIIFAIGFIFWIFNIRVSKERFSNSDIKTYVINLDHREQKWADIQEYLKESGLKLNRFSAIDGRKLTDFVTDAIQFNKTRFLKRGEIGCYLSHCQLWKNSVDNNIDNILILEDDVKIVDNFKEKLKDILNEARDLDWDIILLGHTPHYKAKNKTVSKNIEKTFDNFYGAHGYLVSIKGANKLVQQCSLGNINLPVDVMFYSNNNLNIYNSKERIIKVNGKISDTQIT